MRNFDEMTNAVTARGQRGVMAVAAAGDMPVISAAVEAREKGVADSVLVGDGEIIRKLVRECGASESDFEIIDCAAEDAAQRSVELVKCGRAGFLMKGFLDTKDILRAVVKEENGLRTGRLMSHLGLFDGVPGTDRVVMMTDGGMVMYPTLEDKRALIENAASAMRAMGIACPSVAVLCAVEKLNPKMKETVDAAALADMGIEGCTVVGPISYDVAMSEEIARHKGFDSTYCGHFDIFLVPDITCGNLLGKSWTVTASARMAGLVTGAKVPIVLASRGATAEEKFCSIAAAALISAGSEL